VTNPAGYEHPDEVPGKQQSHNLVKATIEGLSQLRTAAQILAVRVQRGRGDGMSGKLRITLVRA